MKIVFALIVLFLFPLIALAVPNADAGADRAILTNETLVLDGSASTGCDDLLQTDGNHSRRWEFGYGDWTYQGSLTAPIAYPIAGVYTVTLKCYDSGGALDTDTTTITVTDVVEGSSNTIADTGNPVTNGTNLCARFATDAGVDNPVVTLTAGVIYRMSCAPPNRTGAGYLTVRTSAFASLPNSTTRVDAGDDANLAIIETDTAIGPAIAVPAISSAHHYRFVGILWRKKTASANWTGDFVALGVGGTAPTSLSQSTHHWIFDRNRFDGGNTTSNTRRAIRIGSASDVAVVNSDLQYFKEAGADSQTVLMLQGERLNITNNFLDAAGEIFMCGSEDPTIVNHIPSYMIFRRNHFKKNLGYFSGAASFGETYFGVDFTVKNLFELKNGAYISVQGNLFENSWSEEQDWAIVMTLADQGGGWTTIKYVDFAHNKLDKFFWALQLNLETTGTTSIPVSNLLFRHNAFTRFGHYQLDNRHYLAALSNGDQGGGDRIFFVSNSFVQNGGPNRFTFTTNSPYPSNFYFWNNINAGDFVGVGSTSGEAAFNASLSSSNITKNLWYLSAGTNPVGSTDVGTLAAVGYTDFANQNLFLAANTTVGLLGGRPGADTVEVNTLTSGAVSGVWTGCTVYNWHIPCS